MRRSQRSLALTTAPLAFLSVFVLSAAGGEPKDYLKDGKLKEKIEVLQLHGGFAGMTGTYFTIEPDGSWATGPVLPKRETRGDPKAKGKLTADQLAELAKALARHDLATLPSHGETTVNPAVVRVRFGDKVSELQPKPGKASEDEDKAVRARYAGIVEAVTGLLKDPKAE